MASTTTTTITHPDGTTVAVTTTAAASAAVLSELSGCTLHYFPLPGRGEPVRLALALSGQPWTDHRIPGKEWGAFKPQTPWGSMPSLELADGTHLGQTRALMRFVGKLSGLFPDDVRQAALVDGIMDAVDDMLSATNKVGQGLDQAAKEAARAEAALSGTIEAGFARLDATIAQLGSGGCCVGSGVTVADLMVNMPPLIKITAAAPRRAVCCLPP
jgi:glutathione S-transferase